MPEKFLKEVVGIIIGKQVDEIAELLNSKKHVNEFTIAKKLDITINQTRNLLYRIADQGLVSSIRKKDKKKGWYTYFWKLEILKSLEFLKGTLVKRIEQINHQIKSRETKQFFICERCNIEFNEENALLHNFTCNECGGIFSIKDNSKLLKELKKNQGKIEKKLSFIEEEIQKENEQIEKARQRELKKEEKEKAIKKAEASAKRKAARLKTAAEKKKIENKVVKKKTVKKKVMKKKTATKVIKKKVLVKKSIKSTKSKSPKK